MLRLAAGWLLTRALLVTLLVGALGYPDLVGGDIGLYRGWAAQLVHGRLPGDGQWQYPPAAGLALAVPRLLGGSYDVAFVALALVVDAAVLWALVRSGRQGLRAGWVWVVAVCALGPVVLARFDLLPTLAAVAAVTLLARGRATRSGIVAGAGAAVKLWPAVVLAAAPRGARRSWLLAFAGCAALLELGAWLVLGGSSGGVGQASGRRVELESVAATPFVLARALGADVGVVTGHGAQELDVTGSAGIALALLLLGVVLSAVVVAIGWRRSTSPSPYLPVAALGTVLVLSPVLSAQYVLWLLGLGCVALASAAPSRRWTIGLVCLCGLTQGVYPLAWSALLDGASWAALLLLARNALLVAFVLTTVRAAVRSAEP
jgi:hypothetical protein